MWRKKQYKRSGWFEGLLYAEDMIKRGYSINHINDEPLWFTKVDDSGIKTQYTLGYSLSGKKDGAIAYIQYKQDVLEKLK